MTSLETIRSELEVKVAAAKNAFTKTYPSAEAWSQDYLKDTMAARQLLDALPDHFLSIIAKEREDLVEAFSKKMDEYIEEYNDYEFEDGGDPEYRDRRNAIQSQKQSAYRQAKSALLSLLANNKENE